MPIVRYVPINRRVHYHLKLWANSITSSKTIRYWSYHKSRPNLEIERVKSRKINGKRYINGFLLSKPWKHLSYLCCLKNRAKSNCTHFIQDILTLISITVETVGIDIELYDVNLHDIRGSKTPAFYVSITTVATNKNRYMTIVHTIYKSLGRYDVKFHFRNNFVSKCQKHGK